MDFVEKVIKFIHRKCLWHQNDIFQMTTQPLCPHSNSISMAEVELPVIFHIFFMMTLH